MQGTSSSVVSDRPIPLYGEEVSESESSDAAEAAPAEVTLPPAVKQPAGPTGTTAAVSQTEQVDPFRIGYNMGMQNVHLETLRTKLDDNLELLKSHFHSLRESNKTNYDSVRRLHLEYNKQFTAELKDGIDKMFAKLSFVEGQLLRDRETMRELSKQQWESMQKHFDDRLENIKDTVKVTGLLLICLNAVILFMVNNQQQQQASTQQQQHNGGQFGGQKIFARSGDATSQSGGVGRDSSQPLKSEPQWIQRLFSKS